MTSFAPLKKQTANTVLLVRPARFGFNAETAKTNRFQSTPQQGNEEIQRLALEEFEQCVATLQKNGVHVLLFDDTPLPVKPDAIFPNNWVTFHADATVVLYPMCTPNRRIERRQDIIDAVGQEFAIHRTIDLTHYEKEDLFLEGTGSIVFDHDNAVAYACLSPRTHLGVLQDLCEQIGYSFVTFTAQDQEGAAVYHTNVMMCIGDRFAVVCLESITNAEEREAVERRLQETGHEIVEISFDQMNHFAGNMLQLQNSAGDSLLLLSQQAYDILRPEQRSHLESFATLVPVRIPTIETIGGGSARCMVAEVFLP